MQAFLPVSLSDFSLSCMLLLNKNIKHLNCLFCFFTHFWEHFEIYWRTTLYKLRERRRRRWEKERENIDLGQVWFSFGSLLNITNNLNIWKLRESCWFQRGYNLHVTCVKLFLSSKRISLCVSWNLIESRSYSSYFISSNCLL